MKKIALIAGASLLALGSMGTAEAQVPQVGTVWSQFREKVVVRQRPVVRKRVVRPATVFVPGVVVRTAPVVQRRVVVRRAPVVRKTVIVR